jgi:sulfur-oxidizing protein SoxX
MRALAFAVISSTLFCTQVIAASAPRIVGDGAPDPLTSQPGDPARGRAIVVDRTKGLCLLCHTGPFPEQRFQGDIAPSLAGAGERWSTPQLRLRMIDSTLLNPDSVMPSYFKIEGRTRVAPAYRGQPILDAQQIEDVVAFLATLREAPARKETP